MTRHRSKRTAVAAYDVDLAYVHDDGFTQFAHGAAPGVLQTLRDAGIGRGLVVDLGCGSGVWAEELIGRGYDVVGVDISRAMINLARGRVPEATFHVDSFVRFKIPPCRAVTALGEVLNYQFDKRNNQQSLRTLFERIHAALEPGGLFVCDFATVGRDRGRGRGFWEGDDWTTLVEFHTDSTGEELTRRIVTFRRVGDQYRRREETHVLRLYRPAEIAALLRAAGFRVRHVRSYGDFRLPEGLAGLIATAT